MMTYGKTMRLVFRFVYRPQTRNRLLEDVVCNIQRVHVNKEYLAQTILMVPYIETQTLQYIGTWTLRDKHLKNKRKNLGKLSSPYNIQ